MIILTFDTETNGLPKNPRSTPNITNYKDWPNIVQFSYLLYDTESSQIILKHDFIIRVSNGVMITKESSEIHGITNDISEEKGVPMEAALNAFFENFKVANLVVAHNVDFDKNFVIAEIFRIVKNKMGSKYWLNMATDIACAKKYYCTMQEGTDLCNIKAITKIEKKEYIKFPTLGELCKHLFGYEPKKMHNAMNDVVVCFQCFCKMYFDLNICEENLEVFDMVKNVM